jgi:hypothetical protein
MASISKRRKTDIEDYRNWTIKKLREELDKASIATAPSFPLGTLRKLYEINVLNCTVTGRRVSPDTESGGPGHSSNPGVRVRQPGQWQEPPATRGDDGYAQDAVQIQGLQPHIALHDSAHIGPGVDRCSGTAAAYSAVDGSHHAPRSNTQERHTPSVSQSAMTTTSGDAGIAMAPLLTACLKTMEKLSTLIPVAANNATPTGPMNVDNNSYDLASYYSQLATSGNFPTPSGSGVSTTRYGTAPEDVPHMDLVSPAVRKQIIEGKDVNLACLLNPYYDISQKDDTRLKRSLSIGEFMSAFGKYKRIMCQTFPERRDELDQYEANISHIHQVYGDRFYEYHKLFSFNSAMLLQQKRIKLDWSRRDMDLLQRISTGANAKFCGICGEVSHDTKSCLSYNSPQVQSPPAKHVSSSASSGSASGNQQIRQSPGTHRTSEDRQGRDRVFYQGEFCNNYNEGRDCWRTPCTYLHACKRCKSDHPASKCVYASGTQYKPKQTTQPKKQGKSK